MILRLRRDVTVVAVGAVGAVLLAAGAPAGAAATRTPDLATVRLGGSVFPGLDVATRGSDVAAGQRMQTVLALHENTSGLDALNAKLYDAKDPDYHHFLTEKQIVADFAVPAAT